MDALSERESSDAIQESVRFTLLSNTQMVKRWMVEKPGSWGFLAGKAVIASRERLGRPLTDPERREVWSLLWQRLTELKSGGKAS